MIIPAIRSTYYARANAAINVAMHLALSNWRCYINKFGNFDDHRNLRCVDLKCELSYRKIAYKDRKK